MNSFKLSFQEHVEVAQATLTREENNTLLTSKLCCDALLNGHKILIFGNGGSASDAQHIAAELVGRFKRNRRAIPCISLNTDTSAITAISNDFGYSSVFERQIDALAKKGDVVIGISTSGTSENVLRAMSKAKELDCTVVGLTGNKPKSFNELADVTISVPSDDTARIQEMHILIGHIICDVIERMFD